MSSSLIFTGNQLLGPISMHGKWATVTPSPLTDLFKEEMAGYALQRPKPKKKKKLYDLKRQRKAFLSLVRRQNEYLLYGLSGLCQEFQVRDMGKQTQGCQWRAGLQGGSPLEQALDWESGELGTKWNSRRAQITRGRGSRPNLRLRVTLTGLLTV